jgi:uncharacterized small protein (DUF1192 family)
MDKKNFLQGEWDLCLEGKIEELLVRVGKDGRADKVPDYLREFTEDCVRKARVREARFAEVVLARSMVSGAEAETKLYKKLWEQTQREMNEKVTHLQGKIAQLEASMARRSANVDASASHLDQALESWNVEIHQANEIRAAAIKDSQEAFALLNAQVELLKVRYPEIALELGFMG